jgi:hypothetical protein
MGKMASCNLRRRVSDSFQKVKEAHMAVVMLLHNTSDHAKLWSCWRRGRSPDVGWLSSWGMPRCGNAARGDGGVFDTSPWAGGSGSGSGARKVGPFRHRRWNVGRGDVARSRVGTGVRDRGRQLLMYEDDHGERRAHMITQWPFRVHAQRREPPGNVIGQVVGGVVRSEDRVGSFMALVGSPTARCCRLEAASASSVGYEFLFG